jgi:hypothetical protein
MDSSKMSKDNPAPKACRSCSLMVVADFQFFRDVGQKSVQKVKKLKNQIEKSS